MNIRPILNESDYDSALDRVDILMNLDPKMGTKESDELEILAMLIEKYEEEAWTISEPNQMRFKIPVIDYKLEEDLKGIEKFLR